MGNLIIIYNNNIIIAKSKDQDMEYFTLTLKKGDAEFPTQVEWDQNNRYDMKIQQLLSSLWKDKVFRLSDHPNHLSSLNFDFEFSRNRHKPIYITKRLSGKPIYIAKRSSGKSIISRTLEGAGNVRDYMPKDAWVEKKPINHGKLSTIPGD